MLEEESHGGAGPDSELSKPVDSDTGRSVTVTVIISNCTCTVTLGVSLFTRSASGNTSFVLPSFHLLRDRRISVLFCSENEQHLNCCTELTQCFSV